MAIINDWIVAGLNNPDFTSYDFSTIAGMDLNNTQMLPAEKYLESDFIKNHEAFKDSNGNFSEKKFKEYHKKRAQDFNEFQVQEYPKGLELDMFDTDRVSDSRVKDIRFEIGRHANPDRQAIGIEGVRVWSSPTQSKSEIAQAQKIWDTKEQKFKDYSVNDKALVNGIVDWVKETFSDPLVMAQWEEDGEHIDPITGLVKKHAKGEYKLNEKGTYYYETLGDRNPLGKEVLSRFDTLSVDGEGINKYDFFDSDDVQKSVAGVIAKNVVRILPLFTPVGGVYSTVLLAREFSKALPMLYGFATILGDSQEAPKWMNTVAAWGTQFSPGTSQYAKENTFSFENFGNLVADVALQWGQQKAIATAFNTLRGSTSYVDDALKNAQQLYKVKSSKLGHSEELWEVCKNKFLPEAQKLATQSGQLGRDISMAYMAIVSNSDLYNEMMNRGLTKTEAAAIALGSTLGMFTLNKYTGLGELFFDDATDDALKLARKSITDELKDASGMFKAITKSDLPEPNKLLSLIQKASDKASDVLSKFNDGLKYHTLKFAGKSFGEGLEEVSEELIMDTSKAIYQLAGQLGANTTLEDVGAWENAVERYTMSFIGGAMGGGIFYGKEAFTNRGSVKQDIKNQEMATLIRNGHVGELREAVYKMKKDGKLGSTKLSASKYEITETGDKVWLTASNKEDSQNDAIGNAILEKINALETVINNNQVNLTDDQLFENMVLSEKRYKRYQKIAPLTNYYQDFNNILTKLLDAELEYKEASETIEGKPGGRKLTDARLSPEEETTRKESLALYKQQLEDLRKQKDEFLSGNTSLDYTRKLGFIMDPMLHSQYLSIDRDQFFKETYGDRLWSDLNQDEKIQFQADWFEKVQTTLKEEINQSWDKFKQVSELINPELAVVQEQTPLYKTFISESEQLFAQDLGITELQKSYVNFNTQLDGESDELYESRNTKLIIDGVEESDEEFALRQYNRARTIEEYNQQKEQEWVDKMHQHLQKVDYKLDPFTYRYLRKVINHRQKDILEHKLKLSLMPSQVRSVIKQLNPDLSNLEEIREQLLQLVVKQHDDDINKGIGEDYQALLNELVTTKVKNKLYKDFKDQGEPEYINWEDDGSGMADLYEKYTTIPEIIEAIDRKDADVPFEIDEFTNEYVSPEQVEQIKSILLQLQSFVDEDTPLFDIIQDVSGYNTQIKNSKNARQALEFKKSAIMNTLDTFVSDIETSPIYNFIGKLKNEIKNPIGELIQRLAQKNGDEIPNIEELLNVLQDSFENIDDTGSLILDDKQMADLIKVRDYLKLIEGFMYAASANPDKNNPMGHNQVINSFAQTHKDVLIADWEVLPEIDSDYYITYSQAFDRYKSEIDSWIQFSNQNSVNKISKFVKTDKAFTQALFDNITSRDLKIEFDGQQVDLLQGISSIDDDDVEIKLFNAEKVLHKNFQTALAQSGLSVPAFLEQTGLLNKLIPSIEKIKEQKVSKLSDTLKKEDLTDFDLLQYYAQIFTLDPSKFYKELRERVENNTNVAPITAQEYDSKLSKAIETQAYRDFIAYAHKLSKSPLPLLRNSIFIPGVAGSGKTVVVLSSINNPDEEILVAGPTARQAKALQQSLNRTYSYTFPQLLETLVGEAQLKEIEAELNTLDNTGKIKPYSGKYFTVSNVNGSAVFTLNRGVLTFNKLDKTPKKLIIDEATHLSSLELQILDEYAESVGAVNYLAGDPNQRGYFNKKTNQDNIPEDVIFCSRTPKLSVSLRDNNLQKYVNQEKVRMLQDSINDSLLTLPQEELKFFWDRAINIMSKFNFQVYNHDELYGDLITPDLDEALLTKLKKSSSICFIGKKDSPYLQKLKDAGINPAILSIDEMQGDEYDFAVIDHDWKKPSANITVKEFTSTLYTAMTRATTASVFIDNGLSAIIGKNTLSNNKSKAPSIKAGIDELRAKKLDLISRLNLETFVLKADEASEEKVEVKPKVETYNPKDFEDPTAFDTDPDLTQEVKKYIESSYDDEQDDLQQYFSKDMQQIIEVSTDTTLLGVTDLGKQTRTIMVNNQEVTKEFPVWSIDKPAEGPLRNLQAFRSKFEDLENPDGPVEIIKYQDKLDAQKYLFDLKSAIIFQHSYSDTRTFPAAVRQIISQQDWDQGQLLIEVRTPTDTDVTHLNAYIKDYGLDIKGNKYIINVVFKTKLKNGREAIFDLGGLPSVKDFADKIPTISNNLKKRISKLETKLSTETNESAKRSYQNTIEDIKQRLSGLDETLGNYKKLVDSWISEFNNNGEFSLPISPDMINWNKTTWFQKFENTSMGIQLGGYLDPITGVRSYDKYNKESDTTIERTTNSLMLNHPELVFSPIYTYAKRPNGEDFELMDFNLVKGKAIVFVTSDTLLRPDQLWSEYQAQKSDMEHKTARVRAIILDNYGLTFSQLIDPDFIKMFSNEKDERKPLRQNFNGIRMFTSMWNWRAGLMQFNEALSKWKQQHSYSDDDVVRITQAAQDIYDGQDESDTITKYRIKQEDLVNLNTFNTDICKEIPTFRLGFSKNGNGFYVRSENVEGSSLYSHVEDATHVNLLAITPQKAIQFYKLTDRILKLIVDSGYATDTSLGLQLFKPKKDASDEDQLWPENEMIDLGNVNHRRSLSGLLSYQNSAIVLESDNIRMQYTKEFGDQWSIIPNLISKFVRNLTYFQDNEADLDSNDSKSFTLTIQGDDKEIDINEQFGDILVGEDALLQFTKNGKFDTSLWDLMNLMFIGTVADIHEPLKPGQSRPQLEDAYFKRGFFINPDLSRKSQANDYEIVNISNNGETLFYEIATSPSLFRSDTNVRTSGFGLRINELHKQVFNEASVEEKKAVEDPQETFKKTYPELAMLIEDANKWRVSGKYEFTESDARQIIRENNKNLLSAIESAIHEEDTNIMALPMNQFIENGKILTMTLGDYVNSQIENPEPITEVEFVDNTIYFKQGNTQYSLTEQFEVQVVNTNTKEPSTYSRPVPQTLPGGKITKYNTTFKDSILEYVGSDEGIQKLVEYSDDLYSTEDFQELGVALNQAFENQADSDIEASLQEINRDYSAIFGIFLNYLEQEDNELQKILYNCIML